MKRHLFDMRCNKDNNGEAQRLDSPEMYQSVMSVAENYHDLQTDVNEQRVYLKVKCEGNTKRLSQAISRTDLAELKHRILVDFEYLQRDEQLPEIPKNLDKHASQFFEQKRLRSLSVKQKIFDDINNFQITLIVYAKTDLQKAVNRQVLKAKQLPIDDLLIIENQDDYDRLVKLTIEADMQQKANMTESSNPIIGGISKLFK